MAERLPRLRPAELDETQRRLYDELVSGPRSRGPVPLTGAGGQLEGPFNAMLFAPGTGAPLLALGTAVRFGSGLTPRAREIAILAVAAHSSSAYELYAHERARPAGWPDRRRVRRPARPTGPRPGRSGRAGRAAGHQRAARPGGGIPDDLYRAAEQALGRAGLVELATLAGYYLTLAMIMRTFLVGARAGDGRSRAARALTSRPAG